MSLDFSDNMNITYYNNENRRLSTFSSKYDGASVLYKNFCVFKSNHQMYRMSDFNDLDKLAPCLIEDTQYIRKVHAYTVKKIQLLESTGSHTFIEPGGLMILKGFVSGFDHVKDITQNLLNIFKQHDCPLEKIEIDTGMINEYAGCDIECGTRKLIQIEYMCDDCVYEEKRLRRIEKDDEYSERKYDPTPECDRKRPIIPPDFTVLGQSDVYFINIGKCSTKV